MGSALHIPLPLTRKGETISVKIAYRTTEKSPALLWLEKEYVDRRSDLDRELSQYYPRHQADRRKEIPLLVQSMPADPRAQRGSIAR